MRRLRVLVVIAVLAAATVAVPAVAGDRPASGPPDTAGNGNGNQPAVDIVDPTSASPATVEEGGTLAVTFTTDRSGAYALEHRSAGAGGFSAFDGAGSGHVEAGESTAEVAAPSPGTYDLRLRFVGDDGRRAKDTEPDAFVVDTAGAPEPATVAITEPGDGETVPMHSGGTFAVAFTTDRAGTYTIGYRSESSDSADVGAAFPDPGATATTGPGSVALALTAPADLGSYDLVLHFETPEGFISEAVAEGALFVTGPAVVPADRCDDADPALCLFPFPNDRFTAAAPGTDTGRRVNLNVLSMPRNAGGKPVDPTEWNRNDGFSPGAMLLARVPGLDLHETWGTTGFPERQRDHLADIARYETEDAPIVVVDAATGERHPFWSELDTHPDTTHERRSLIVRPAVNFEEGTRYVVALRDLRDASGEIIEAGPTFASYRDAPPPAAGEVPEDPAQLRYEEIFTTLEAAGIPRDDLYLAWDFTVASARNLAGRALHIRDDAFEQLGDTDLGDGVVTGDSPTFTVTSVVDFTPGEDRETARRIRGTVTVPNYLTHPQEQATVSAPDPLRDPLGDVHDLADEELPVVAPGSRFNYGGSDDGLPRQNPALPTFEADFVCDIPRTASTASPAHLTLYGHGLLGSRDEATGSSTADMQLRNFGICATNWMGMATEDLANVATILADVSHFPSLADRAQQGFLAFMYLGRAMIHPDGFSSHEAFQDGDGVPLVDASALHYDGNSQGGIMGGALTALAPDFTRAVLGVPGMNYSTLLNRSVDWEGAYAEVFYATYPDKMEQQLLFELIQMLWDRAEANGYAHHMTADPYDNTPAHQVMLQVAFADHQVANVAVEVEGRTIGAHLRTPPLADGQHWSVDPAFGFQTFGQTPLAGESVLIYWYSADRGNATPPNGNIPSTSGEDPHGDPRKDNAGSDQKAHFLLTGEVVDVCGTGPCVTTDATRAN